MSLRMALLILTRWAGRYPAVERCVVCGKDTGLTCGSEACHAASNAGSYRACPPLCADDACPVCEMEASP